MLLGGLVLGTRVFDLPSSTVLVFALIFFRIYQRLRSFQATLLSVSVLNDVPTNDTDAPAMGAAS